MISRYMSGYSFLPLTLGVGALLSLTACSLLPSNRSRLLSGLRGTDGEVLARATGNQGKLCGLDMTGGYPLVIARGGLAVANLNGRSVILREMEASGDGGVFEGGDVTVKLRYLATSHTSAGDIFHRTLATITTDQDSEWVSAMWNCGD